MGYTALIVDDEYTARETMRLLVNWEDLGYEPPSFAANGQEALEALEKRQYDIIFTDIEMPVMNGIELIKAIREKRPNQRIVIISCHEKFDYARQAFRMGVEDYIIKDLVTENELRSYLCSVAVHSAADSGAQAHNSELSAFFADAVNGKAVPSAPLPQGGSAVFCVMLDDYEKLLFERGQKKLFYDIAAFTDRIKYSAACHNGGAGIFVLCDIKESASTLMFISSAITYSNMLRLEARKENLGRISIGVSDPFDDASFLTEACAQAGEAANMRIIDGADKTTLYNSIGFKKNMLDFERVDFLLKRIEQFLYNGNAECVKLIEKLYAIDTAVGFADINYYMYANSKLWIMLVMLAQSKGFEHSSLFSDENLNIEKINRLENSGMMAQVFTSFALKIISSESSKEKESIVDNVLLLIEREYMNDISLSYLSSKLHTNKSYLCRVFKERMGENLMQYVMRKKIERAKYLLYNTNMKLYEIADSLGFTSQAYFSSVFKKYVGFSPHEFKKDLRQVDDTFV